MAEAKAEEPTYSVFGVGNALLDVSADVPEEIFEQYSLDKGVAVLAEDKHMPLFEYLHAKSDVQYIPGGATLNSIRVANWMLKSQNLEKKCSYVSIVGKDSNGKTMVDKCGEEGLVTSFAEHAEEATGQCAVCILAKERTLVASLAACNKFPVGEGDYMLTTDATALWQNSKICYMAGFWLTVNAERMKEMAKWYAENNRTFCLNISAPFLAQFFLPQMKEVLANTDILFGNETECEKLAEAMGLKDTKNAEACAKEFLTLSNRPNFRVIITQGSDPCIVATKGTDTKTYKTPALESNLIVDTNGAGDAFVGGFISALSLGKSEEDCVAWGNYAAQFIIQTSGTQFKSAAAPPS